MSSKEYLYGRIRQQFREGLESPEPVDEKTAAHQAIAARYTLNDVVLGASIRQQLEEALAKIKYFQKIYVEWGFASVDPAGKGVVLNFYGPPGTGKTLTAEALAGSLGKPLMFISISDLESKFMGDTSKNIVQVFKTALAEGAVLFFDEADTLLGKRLSSVTQGIDNEVNAMRSTLLIELERHEGVVVFATNFGKNYDAAFVSRISQHIKFELPGAEERRSIWSKMLVVGIPIEASRDELLEALTDLSDGFSGREIRSCMRLALPKPLLEQGEPILLLRHLEEAIAQMRTTLVELTAEQRSNGNIKLDAARKMLGVN
ncbi:ATP-binding protein [Pseudomonas sp. ANT_H14]|uniref:ATP-binding protein n=1 Tax=unclassified Pseudomonas TaxID=196821 RepID=UPI0011EE3D67|nr:MULTISPECIES: ATP-binding protein [unclassified Pseudomonas]KAA0943733.1 ATP-binding protein [Pseudomonas sp. ANT_H4]KAA0950124.1 ATP-binding protein [Pseudomonas sp. ANT_H14]